MAVLSSGRRFCVYWRELQLLSRAREIGLWRTFSEERESEGKGKTVKLSVSSLRIDAVAAAGLDLSRQKIWEAALDNLLLLNGKPVKKKGSSVSEGDIIEVDTIFRDSADDGDEEGVAMVKRGRVEVMEIGDRTKKGGYHLTLTRYKHFSKFQIKT